MDAATIVGLLDGCLDTALHAQAEFLGGTAEGRRLSKENAFAGNAGSCLGRRGGLGLGDLRFERRTRGGRGLVARLRGTRNGTQQRGRKNQAACLADFRHDDVEAPNPGSSEERSANFAQRITSFWTLVRSVTVASAAQYQTGYIVGLGSVLGKLMHRVEYGLVGIFGSLWGSLREHVTQVIEAILLTVGVHRLGNTIGIQDDGIARFQRDGLLGCS